MAERSVLRDRRTHAKVTDEELFFDLIYAFAVTQLSHRLLENLSFASAGQTLILWFAVWLGWQYTCWVTNWFDPTHPRMRPMLFAPMLIGPAMSAAIPGAFAEAGPAFACCYAAIQVGRTIVVLASLPRGHALLPNFRRIFVWELLSASLWLAGGFSAGHAREAFWIAGVLCEYAAPMLGFVVPGLGRSASPEWTIDGGHLATGASFSQAPHVDLPTTLALAAFGVMLLMALAVFASHTDRLMTGSLAALILATVAIMQTLNPRKLTAGHTMTEGA